MENLSALTPGFPLIDRYKIGGFEVGRVFHAGPRLLFREMNLALDLAAPTLLTPEALAPIMGGALTPELLVIGTGDTLDMLPKEVRAALREAGFKLEVMATPAACRTYNVVAGEGRLAAAALWPI